jgi:hypothetical protein
LQRIAGAARGIADQCFHLDDIGAVVAQELAGIGAEEH